MKKVVYMSITVILAITILLMVGCSGNDGQSDPA
jgi:hypothetical protein